MRRRSGAGEMIDVGEFDPPAAQPLRQLVDYVMLDEVEPRFVLEMPQILGPSGLEIIDANHLRALADEAVAEVRTDEARAPRHERNLLVPTLHTMLLPSWAFALGFSRFFDVALQLGS